MMKVSFQTPKASPRSDLYLTPPRSSYGSQSRTPPSTASQGGADYKCQNCDFSTNRINVLLFHNKMHSSEKKNVPETKGKIGPKRFPALHRYEDFIAFLSSLVVKPPTPPPRKQPVKKTKVRSRPSYADSEEDTDSDDDDFENNRGITMGDSASPATRGSRRSLARAPPKKRQPRKSAASVALDRSPSSERPPAVVAKPKDAAKQAQIKTSILADWGDDDDGDDDDTKESETIQSPEEPREDTSSTESTPHATQEKPEDSPKKPIRNIPKKDRFRNLDDLDEFYKNQVPSSSASNATDSAVIVLDSEDDSDIDVRKQFEEESDKERDDLGHSSDDQVEEVIDEIDIDKQTDDESEVQIIENKEKVSNEVSVELSAATDVPAEAEAAIEAEAEAEPEADNEVEAEGDPEAEKEAEQEVVGGIEEDAETKEEVDAEKEADAEANAEVQDELQEQPVAEVETEAVTETEEAKKDTIEVDETRPDECQVEAIAEQEPIEQEEEKQNERDHELDSLLLQRGAELLDETSQLTASIETVGVLGKKRLLQRKHRITESEETPANPPSAEGDQPLSQSLTEEVEEAEVDTKPDEVIENGELVQIQEPEAEVEVEPEAEVEIEPEEEVEIEPEPEEEPEAEVEVEIAPEHEEEHEAEQLEQEIYEQTPDKPESAEDETRIEEIVTLEGTIEDVQDELIEKTVPEAETVETEEEDVLVIAEPLFIVEEAIAEDVSENKENENLIEVEVHEVPAESKESKPEPEKPERLPSIEEPRPPSRVSLRKSKSVSTESRRSSRSTRQKSKSQSIEKAEESQPAATAPVALALQEEEETIAEVIEEETTAETEPEGQEEVIAEVEVEQQEEIGKPEEILENEPAESSENHEKPEEIASPAKTECNKIEVDCFDFKEEEDDIPKILSRPKRRPLEKRFKLDSIEDIRKNDEEELKIMKSEQESREKPTKAAVGKSPMKENDTSAAEPAEIQTTPEKGLPIKERNKRIFKSRNRSMHSESDSFSNEEKTPTKQPSESAESSAVKLSPAERKLEPTPVSFELSVATSIESEIVDTLINNLPLSSPNATSCSFSQTARDSPTAREQLRGAGQKHSLAAFDESTQPKLQKPIKMTFAISSGKNDKQTARIVKTDSDIDERKSSSEENESAPRPPRLTTKIAISKRKVIESSVEQIQSPPKRQKSSDDDSKSSSDKNVPSNDLQAIELYSPVDEKEIVMSEPVEFAPSKDLSAELAALAASAISSITTTLPVTSTAVAAKLTPANPPPRYNPEPKKKRKSNYGKVEVVIGHDAAGNAITAYQKPRTGPVVHLPSHIRPPDVVASPTSTPFSAKGGSQIVITSKGTLLTTNTTTDAVQSVSTVTNVKSSRSAQQSMSPNKIQVHSQKIIAAAQAVAHSPQHQFVEDSQRRSFVLNEQVPASSPQQKAAHAKARGKQQAMSAAAASQLAAIETAQRTAASRAAKTRVTKKQQMQLQQQELARRQAEAEKAAELSHNIQDNQLLAIPAENFDGPAGAFYLCTAENNTYFPIDKQPLYLDEKNQLVPMPGATGPMNVAAVHEDIIDDGAGHASSAAAAAIEYAQAASSQITSNLANLDESQNLTYLINTGDGQQILLDQQSMLQLTANGELPQFITADGQQLILQGSPQEILAAIAGQQAGMNIVGGQQIIIPEDMTVIEEEGNNHDILAAALADTEVFQQDQYMGDVLQGNGIEVVEPNVLHFPISQAATSETSAILPPIMSALEQPSKSGEPALSVDCANLDERLAVIGVSAQQTNVPASLELPITVTNPDIAPKMTNATSGGIYPSVGGISSSATQLSPSIPIASEQDLTYELFDASTASITSISEKHVSSGAIDNDSQDTASMDIDSNSEIIPNTPESVTNQARTPELTGFTSDNSNNSCEIPLQSNLISRPPSTDGIESRQQHIIGNRRNSDFLPNHYNVSHLNQHQHSSLHSSPIRVDTIESISETYGRNHSADSMLIGPQRAPTRHRPSALNGIGAADNGDSGSQRDLFLDHDDDDDVGADPMENHQFIVEEHMANDHQFGDNNGDNDDDDVEDQYNR